MSQGQEEVRISTGQTLREIIDQVAKENAAAMGRFSAHYDDNDEAAFNDGFVCGPPPASAPASASQISNLSTICANLEYDLEKTRQWAVDVEKELEEYIKSDRSADQALQQVVADQEKEIQQLTERAEAAEAALHTKQVENANLLEYINSLVS